VVGAYSFIGGGTIVTQDVLPFSLTSSKRENRAFGINKIGLERRGFSPERLQKLQKAYRMLLAAKLNTTQAVEKMRELRRGCRRRGPAGQLHRTQQARGDQIEMKLGLIAGNGRFPFLLLDAARAQGLKSSSRPSKKKPTRKSTAAPSRTPASPCTGSRWASFRG
jgi:hypothetical protein